MKRRIILFFVLLITMSSCATIFSGSQQNITIAAIEGTKIYYQGVKIAEVRAGDVQATTRVNKCLSSQVLVAKHPECDDTSFFLPARLNGLVFLNILCGGIIGGAIDCATGAACKFPNYVEVDMVRKIALPQVEPAKLKRGDELLD